MSILTNNSGTTLVISNMTVSGTGFSLVGPTSMTILNGSSYDFSNKVTYTKPSGVTAGEHIGTLVLHSTQFPVIPGDPSPTTRSINFSITVIDTLVASVTSLTFSDTVINQTSATSRTVSFTNNGSSSVTLTPTINSTDFTLVSSAAITIAAGQTGSFTLNFTPNSATGMLNATLSVARAIGGPVKITLTGLSNPIPVVTYLTTSGNQLIDAYGQPVRLKAVHWYGLEQAFIPGLLNNMPYKTIQIGGVTYPGIMDSMKAAGFNCFRIAISIDVTGCVTDPAGIGGVAYSPKPNVKVGAWNSAYTNPAANPDLFYPGTDLNAAGGSANLTTPPYTQLGIMTSIEILDKIVAYAGVLNMRIVLDMHCLAPDNDNVLATKGQWYSTTNPGDAANKTVDAMGSAPTRPPRSESQAIAAWKFFAQRYNNNPTVCAFDIINEPYNTGWHKDTNLAHPNYGLASYYERVEAAIRTVNTNVLLILEGVASNYTGGVNGLNGSFDMTPLGTGLTSTQQTELTTAASQGVYFFGAGWGSFWSMLDTVINIPTASQVYVSPTNLTKLPLSAAPGQPQLNLQYKNKIVFSAHDYGTYGSGGSPSSLPPQLRPDQIIDGYKGTGFYASHNGKLFPNNLSEYWRRQWGFIAEQNIAPVWVGEFGASWNPADPTTVARDTQWINALGAYMAAHNMSFSYFAINPDNEASGIGGLYKISGLTTPANGYILQQFKIDILKTAGVL